MSGSPATASEAVRELGVNSFQLDALFVEYQMDVPPVVATRLSGSDPVSKLNPGEANVEGADHDAPPLLLLQVSLSPLESSAKNSPGIDLLSASDRKGFPDREGVGVHVVPPSWLEYRLVDPETTALTRSGVPACTWMSMMPPTVPGMLLWTQCAWS